MKYFKEEYETKIRLSEYRERLVDTKEKRIIDYIISVIGDALIDETCIKVFIREFSCFGGMYDVRTKPETIKGVYDIYTKYPMLSRWAIEELFFSYIQDLYDEYDLTSIFHKLYECFGCTDDMFGLYMNYVDEKAKEYQVQFQESAKELECLKDEYSEQFVRHLQHMICSRHVRKEHILKSLPSSELIKKDEEHIYQISERTRIFFGCCNPVSYTLFDIFLEEGSIDEYKGEPTYYINNSIKEKATFTKQDFLDSMTKKECKKLAK